jgi:hypothetical protein
MFAGVLRRHELMDEMIEAQGVDLLTAVRAGEDFVRARDNCRKCQCEGACREWFLEKSDTPAEFCPNVEFFGALKRVSRGRGLCRSSIRNLCQPF